jgi:2-oxoisovalerate dehydrogenase E1 component
MGVYWSKAAARKFDQQVEIVDLRTLYPLDEVLLMERIKLHGKCLIVTEEQMNNSFAEALAGRLSNSCFQFVDAPINVIGALNVPAIPMNMVLEQAVLPGANKVELAIKHLLAN